MIMGADLIQGAISRPGGAVPTPMPKRNAPSGACARVELAVLTSAGAPAPVEPASGHFLLAPGGTFSVRVTLLPASQGETDTLDFTEEEFLSLAWEGPQGLGVQPVVARVLAADLDNRPAMREFSLTTGPDAKGVQGRLSLRRGLRGTQEVRSVELRIEERGVGQVLPAALQGKIQVDLEQAPKDPEATAFIHIETTGQQLRLHWFPVKGASDATLIIAEPAENLMDPAGKRNTEKIFDDVREFFRLQCHQLRGWLAERVTARSDVTLIIQECAETRVPWEMLELPLKQGSKRIATPVGALIKVVRWLRTVDLYEGEIPLRMDRRDWSGRAMSYVADDELEQAERELEALKDCHQRFDDVEKLSEKLGELAELTHPVAMLFVASHGERQGGELDPSAPEPPLTRLMRRLPDSVALGIRPLAFINACHSGLLERKGTDFTGLPEKLLGKVAGAYLGVLGRIEEEVAATVGARILKAAREEGGVCIPELLRQVRKEAFEKLNVNDNDSRRAYVSKFMYVFYGTPEAYLKLEPQGGSDD